MLFYTILAVVFLVSGSYMMLRPRKVARFRNRGSVNPEPTKGYTNFIHDIGGPIIIAVGLVMSYVIVTGQAS